MPRRRRSPASPARLRDREDLNVDAPPRPSPQPVARRCRAVARDGLAFGVIAGSCSRGSPGSVRRFPSASRQFPARTDEVAGVAVGVALKVVLVLGLRLPERSGGLHIGDGLPWPQAGGVDIGDRVLRDAALLVVDVVDRRAIARADVVALPVLRRRVVNLKYEL